MLVVALGEPKVPVTCCPPALAQKPAKMIAAVSPVFRILMIASDPSVTQSPRD
jgi:hypothetical protein